jgi:hypothetical protein
MIKKIMLALAAVFMSVGLALAAGTVSVEAEGSGTTRMEALRAAWIEAVRSAVGMSMTGSTTLSDDKIDEMIATFSRGHVNAYKVLSESMDNGRWTIRIKADIHDDILQTPSASSGSRSIDLSSSEAAAALSAYDAKKDGAELFVSTLKAVDWHSCMDYTLSIKTIDNKLWLVHRCKVNFDNYFKMANELAKILEKICLEKRTEELDGKMAEEMHEADELFASNLVVCRPDVLSSYFQYPGTHSLSEVLGFNHMAEWYSSPSPGDVRIITSPREARVYYLERSDAQKIQDAIRREIKVTFSVDAGGAEVESVTVPLDAFFCHVFHTVGITPTLGMELKPPIMYFNTFQPLKLSREQLDRVTKLSGGFTID